MRTVQKQNITPTCSYLLHSFCWHLEDCTHRKFKAKEKQRRISGSCVLQNSVMECSVLVTEQGDEWYTICCIDPGTALSHFASSMASSENWYTSHSWEQRWNCCLWKAEFLIRHPRCYMSFVLMCCHTGERISQQPCYEHQSNDVLNKIYF